MASLITTAATLPSPPYRTVTRSSSTWHRPGLCLPGDICTVTVRAAGSGLTTTSQVPMPALSPAVSVSARSRPVAAPPGYHGGMGSHGARHGKVTVGRKAAALAARDPLSPRSAVLAAEVAEQQQPAVSPLGPRGRGKGKNRRDWCRGREGAPHRPQTAQLGTNGWHPATCSWRPFFDRRARIWSGVGWVCRHQVTCAGCGRILRHPGELGRDECPDYDYDATAAQRTRALTEAAEWTARRLSWPRRPVPDGPQGYRRPRRQGAGA
jgi:hypothetical protein